MRRKAVAIVSGGMDSVTLAYLLNQRSYDLHILSFDYGQRHGYRELVCARACAVALKARHSVIDLAGLASHIGGSALTTHSIAVPEGHYEAPTMAATVVPNRNAIMLSIAYGVAVSESADAVACGVHAGDHFIYPDCRPEFIVAFEAMQKVAVKGFGSSALRLEAPFVRESKADIVRRGHRMRVPWQNTWSCYKGGEVHCGVCGTCTERREAFELAEVHDPTEYADLTRHWRQRVQDSQAV